MTDNKNRTVADIRHFFSKSGGNLGESGCVSWMFDKRGLIVVDKATISEEELMDFALDAGAEDVVEEESEYQVLTMPEDFDAVKEALADKGVSFLEAAISMIPKNTVDVNDPKPAKQLLKLLENIEDHDDVQNVSANFDIPDEIMEEVS
jgi:YebC/PmpR family DNA-binding regulatory protein